MKNRSSNLLHRISKWIMKFAYLNILWLFFTLIGLIVFGLFPATISMFVVTRKWLQNEVDIPIFKTFWATYKEELLTGNILGILVLSLSLLLYANYVFILNVTNDLFYLLLYPVLIISIILYSILLYILPIYVHYKMNILQILKNTFVITFVNPLITVGMVSSSIVLYSILFYLPGLLPFFSGSILAFILTYQFHLALKNIKRKSSNNK